MSPSVPIEVLPFDGEPLTTPRALAATLGYTQRMVRYWTDEGCPYYDVDGLRRFRESEVRRWLRKQGRLSKSPAAESNRALRSRNPQSGYTEQGPDRREYMRDYQREWIGRRRADWFADKACLKCGSTEGLQIHHRDPGEKVSNTIWSWSPERRDEEIAKCDVLCADCHKKEHGPNHGGKRRYEAGCRCPECVDGIRRIRAAKAARKAEREGAGAYERCERQPARADQSLGLPDLRILASREIDGRPCGL